MSDINKVIVTGRVTRDSELHQMEPQLLMLV